MVSDFGFNGQRLKTVIAYSCLGVITGLFSPSTFPDSIAALFPLFWPFSVSSAIVYVFLFQFAIHGPYSLIGLTVQYFPIDAELMLIGDGGSCSCRGGTTLGNGELDIDVRKKCIVA